MISPVYQAQVDLLLRILPHVEREKSLALKGGTAINLFVREMPRLSVDIDLTYLPFTDRNTSLQAISDALGRIKMRLEKAMPNIQISALQQSEGQDAKVICRLGQAQVKVEVNTVMRGNLWPVRTMQLTNAAQETFGKFAAIQVVSNAELFGGKLCAALDRQHPRDFFDIQQLFAHEGFNDEIRLGFIAALLSHPRPMHEIVQPRFQDQQKAFETQFSGMAHQSYSYSDFEETRQQTVQTLHAQLTDDDRALLISFKRGEPNWSLFEEDKLRELPAVQWKLRNIQQLKKQNPTKHATQLQALEDKLLS